MDIYSYSLSKEQQHFISSNNDFIILNSCAGSGKTKCLIAKILFLIEKKNINPKNLIVCTYTKSMANTIKTRLKLNMNININDILIGTFHSICYHFIQNRTDQTDSLSLPLSIDMISYEEILIYMYQHLINGLIDISNRYLIIDEYQDCIMMQQKIVTYLLKSKKIRGLYLIGDINQSIFDYDNTITSWLDTLINIKIGSKKGNLLDVLKLKLDTDETYDKIQLMNLSVNYRSTREIVKLGNSLIKENKMESNYTYDKEKYKPKLYVYNSWYDEMDFLCQTLEKYHFQNRYSTLGTICVLSRYNRTLEYLENRLLSMNILTNYIKYSHRIMIKRINLSTIHSAKGLEFDNIFFVNSNYNPNDEKLLYVAITRAKKQLVISSHHDINPLIDLDHVVFKDCRTDKIKMDLSVSFSPKYLNWLGVVELVRSLGGEHIIGIKKILSPIMNFKPITKIVHEKILIKDIPSFFSDNIHITNTQNIFGLYIDALITRHIQYLNNDQIISYQDLNKLILIHYKQSKTSKQFLDDLDKFEQLRKIYNLNDTFYKSSILFDMIKDDTIKIKMNDNFEKKLRDSYLRFSDRSCKTEDIMYDIFIVSLTNPIINERLAYQYLPDYIDKNVFNESVNKLLRWYSNIFDYVSMLIKDSNKVITQKELSSDYLKVIGYPDIMINENTIIDIKTSKFEYPKLDYLLQILIYGLLSDNLITKYQIYNPIYGVVYEWTLNSNHLTKTYIDNVKIKLIDFLYDIIPEIKKQIQNQ